MSDETMVSKEAVLEALLSVHDDRREGRDVVGLGMVREVALDGPQVTVRVAFDDRPVAERHGLEDAIADAVEALDDVSECLVESVVPQSAAPAPAPPSDQAPPAGEGPAPSPGPQGIPGVQHVVAVASGKGGVGKSTVAVNLALALKARGLSVGLLDCDLYGPSAPTLLGIHRRPDAHAGKLLPVEAAGLQVMSVGFLLDDDVPLIWRGPKVAALVRQFVEDVAWQDLDFLVVDLPPGTGDAQLTLVQTVPLTGSLIVTTPSDLALHDAVRGLHMFEQVDVPVFGIVENMSHFVCPHCGERSDVFGGQAAKRTADRQRMPILAEIPLDPQLRAGGDQGRPTVLDEPGSERAAPFLALADAVAERCGVRAG